MAEVPFTDHRLRPVRRTSGRRRAILATLVVFGAVAVATGVIVGRELRASTLQARSLSSLAARSSFHLGSGESDTIRFPSAGPYDRRLGYAGVPAFVERLRARGFEIESQARYSSDLSRLVGWGLFPSYEEKAQAGLSILDRSGRPLFSARYPELIYQSFAEIPTPLIDALLFVENRSLLDTRYATRNPAVEWGRLARGALALGLDRLGIGVDVPGGSTLATQLEKYRHSPDGVTRSVHDKLLQMASASVRAYRGGPDTSATRRQVLTDYFNSAPLAAVPGYGEVAGIPSGLELWYGADFTTVNWLLSKSPDELTAGGKRARVLAYKQALSLLLAVQQPSRFLIDRRDALTVRTHRYLGLLADAGVISAELRDEALALPLDLLDGRRRGHGARTWDAKAATRVRPRLASTLGVRGLYQLDRLDLVVETTLDDSVSRRVTRALYDLSDPVRARAAGLAGPRLLDQGDPGGVVYSFALYEKGEGVNRLVVETDNLDQPLNVNDGVMLDLGSTAKLRTLTTYLAVVASLHDRLHALTPPELRRLEVHPDDRLTRWAIAELIADPHAGRGKLVHAAMQRRYSADPDERFHTGGGWHRFSNFDAADDVRRVSVARAFRDSVNLVFVRVMRDIVNHVIFDPRSAASELLADRHDARRDGYLERFGARESRQYLERFHRKYGSKEPDEMLAALLGGARLTPKRLATILRFTAPELGLSDFEAALATHLPHWRLSEDLRAEVFEAYAPARFDLNDLAYLSRVHPLELWLVGHLRRHPGTSFARVLADSEAARTQAYGWLLDTDRKHAQDQRIRTMLEVDAFAEIHRRWRRLGYPFDSLVPSLGTSIGSSADRPSSLAELMGIILSDGMSFPTVSVSRVRFAEGTPYETAMTPSASAGRRVLAAEVAAVLRRALEESVEFGTGRRARGVLNASRSSWVTIGGKTGTGDHVYKVFDEEGEVTSSRVVSRAAAFVFFAGERYYGVVTAYVKGDRAADYTFTSALATQVFRILAPALQPLVGEPEPLPELFEAGGGHDDRLVPGAPGAGPAG